MAARAFLRRVCDDLLDVQAPLRVLRLLSWSPKVHEQFLRKRARELPKPTYPPLGFDPKAKIRQLRTIRRRLRGRNPVEEALRRKCDELVETVLLLDSRGTKRFFQHSVALFGEPRQAFLDSGVDNLQIARLWVRQSALGRVVEPSPLDAGEAARVIDAIIRPVLGSSCRVRVSNRLIADAAAGATSVALRSDARFSLRRARALAHHEGLWHVLTSVNGYAQPVLSVLGVGLAGYAASQEGGGIVAEYLSGNITSERFRELGERALIVDLAAQGADYLEVYRYLCDRYPADRASRMCERVFRGGVLSGGAPFTKDAVYQRGYCRVFNFIRHAVDSGQTNLVLAFCAGKMSLDDVPLVAALMEEGLVEPPRHLPPWITDLPSLSAEVIHALTMSRFDLGKVSDYYGRIGRKQVSRMGRWRERAEEVEHLAEIAEQDLEPSAMERAERAKEGMDE